MLEEAPSLFMRRGSVRLYGHSYHLGPLFISTPSLAHQAPADPATSPCGHLLSGAHRADLAAELNKAILAAKGKREDSALECIYKQVRPGRVCGPRGRCRLAGAGCFLCLQPGGPPHHTGLVLRRTSGGDWHLRWHPAAAHS